MRQLFIVRFIYSEKLISPSVTSPHDVHLTENEDAVFEVRVTGHPSPDVTWNQGDTSLTPSDRVKIEIDGDVRRLVLGKCQLPDGGKIRITASNKAGLKTEKASLVVKGLFRALNLFYCMYIFIQKRFMISYANHAFYVCGIVHITSQNYNSIVTLEHYSPIKQFTFIINRV